MVVRWTFTDAVAADSYTFAVNPNDGGSPTDAKSIQYQKSSAPSEEGKTLVFEGRDEPNTSSFSGVILAEAQYHAMRSWFRRRNPITMTDDLGRTFTIYITKFEAKRKRARSYPWKHEYTVEYIILEDPDRDVEV